MKEGGGIDRWNLQNLKEKGESDRVAVEPGKPFSAFGSYRQRHGDPVFDGIKSSEAPAKLYASAENKSQPVGIRRTSSQEMRRKLLRARNRSVSDVEREEAWERKKDQHLLEELNELQENRKARTVGRSISDCGTGGSHAAAAGSLSRFNRTRSLTDEDLDELRGSIDLGFGFSNQADPELWNTLPALELCYAINQQYQNNKSSSPASSSTAAAEDTSDLLSESSPMGSPSSSSWMISSPGDHPQQVKTRLRHWAQAVGCTIRQNIY